MTRHQPSDRRSEGGWRVYIPSPSRIPAVTMPESTTEALGRLPFGLAATGRHRQASLWSWVEQAGSGHLWVSVRQAVGGEGSRARKNLAGAFLSQSVNRKVPLVLNRLVTSVQFC